MIFEFGIRLVQAYIFSLLLTLYSDLLLASIKLMPLSVEKVIYSVCELIPQTRPITLLFVFAIFCVLMLSPIKSKISLGGRFNAKVLRTFDVFKDSSIPDRFRTTFFWWKKRNIFPWERGA